MAVEVHVAGPGVDVTRRLEAGEPALLLGRDADCAICLPDPGRSVSRRHLSVWNEGEQLHFHVLSVVNGVQTLAGELPPGARGVLAPGDMLSLASFRVTTRPLPIAPEFMDTWARLQADAEQLAAPSAEATEPRVHDDDPFSDWAFHSNFTAASTQDGLAAATDLRPFLRGLGLDGVAASQLTQGDLEVLGRIARLAVQGLVQASEAAAESRDQVRAEEASATKGEANPLRTDTTLDVKLAYLFGGSRAATGLMPPERAVAQLAADLDTHEQAMGEAVQELLRSVLAEFDPEALKKRLLGAGGRLFESARAWDAYARHYAERTGAEPDWVRQLLDHHFARAYARALLRAKRNTTGRPGP